MKIKFKLTTSNKFNAWFFGILALCNLIALIVGIFSKELTGFDIVMNIIFTIDLAAFSHNYYSEKVGNNE